MTNMHTEIRQFIIDNFLFHQADREVGDNVSLLEGGVIDSTGVLELIAFLEERYDIAVDDQDLIPANLDSVDSLAGFVGRKLEVKSRRLSMVSHDREARPTAPPRE